MRPGHLFATLVAALVLVTDAAVAAEPVTLRIGVLRGPEPLSISRLRGTLEQRLAPKNVKVSWVGPFNAYAPAAEALNADSIDVTVGSSSAAISSVVGSSQISLFAYQWDAGDSSGILVPKDSPIKSLQDLAGKRIAVNRGGTGDYHLTKALEKAGVPSDRVTRAFLSPVDSAAAFVNGHVDAWSAWSIYYTIALLEQNARLLITAKDLDSQNAVIYAVRSQFAKDHPDVLRELLAELQASARWARDHREEAAKLWVQELKLSPAVADQISRYEIREPVTVGEKELVALESLNDWLVSQNLIPRRAAIRDHIVTVAP